MRNPKNLLAVLSLPQTILWVTYITGLEAGPSLAYRVEGGGGGVHQLNFRIDSLSFSLENIAIIRLINGTSSQKFELQLMRLQSRKQIK